MEYKNYSYQNFLSARGKSPSRSSSTERASSSNPYVRQGSLKAWKEEQDRVKAEEDEKEKLKNEKRARSAQKKVNQHYIIYIFFSGRHFYFFIMLGMNIYI